MISALKAAGAHHVGVIAVVCDIEGAVITPFVGIADFHVEGGKLVQGVLLGHVGHPSGSLDALAEGPLQVLHQLFHAGLGLRREVALHIHLAESLAQTAVHRADDTFPAGLVLLLAGEHLAVKLEIGIHKLIAQIGSSGIDDIPCQIGTNDLHISHRKDIIQSGEIGGLGHIQRVNILKIQRMQIFVDINGGNHILEIQRSAFVDGLIGISERNLVHKAVGHHCFQRQHAFGKHFLAALAVRQLAIAGNPEHLGHKVHILVADMLLVGIQVIVAVANAEARLPEVSDGHVAVVGVGGAEKTEEGVQSVQRHHSQLFGDALTIKSGNIFQLTLNGLGTLFLQLHGVHTDFVKVAHLLFHRADGVFL